MAGFNSPSILFLNTWGVPEWNFSHAILSKLRDAGYNKFVEPCAGSFVMSMIMRDCGWEPRQLDTSDVSLFSALCGCAFQGQPIDALDIRIDGESLRIESSDPLTQAAEGLYVQLLVRMEGKPKKPYWIELVKNLVLDRAQHIDQIRHHLAKQDEKLHGLRYRSMDILEHIGEVADDPHAVIAANPPTYLKGFEKFYDTKGRLTWAEPTYRPWDPPQDMHNLMQWMADKRALIFCQMQADPGGASMSPVYARRLPGAPKVGQNVYIVANRPDEVYRYTGGMKVQPLVEGGQSKLNRPTVSHDYEFTPDSKVEVMVVGEKEASYYRDLWMHKLDYKKASRYVAVVVDGYLSGLIGYQQEPMTRPYPHMKAADALLLTFSVGAPHKDRLTRLITMIGLTSSVIKRVLQPQTFVKVARVITAELTKHPEVKGLRGLMKLRSRDDDPKYGFRLIYESPMSELSLEEVVGEWLRKEHMWQTARNRQVTAGVSS